MPYPRKQDPVKHCRSCGTRLVRKRYGRRLEDHKIFLRRERCHVRCRRVATCHPDRPHYGHGRCAPCYRIANRDRRCRVNRALRLRRRFGMTEVEYQALHEAQGGRCAICRRPERRTIRGRVQPLVMDHDHGTERFRALLCHGCNVSLGHFMDDPVLLTRAIEYLQRHRQPALRSA